MAAVLRQDQTFRPWHKGTAPQSYSDTRFPISNTHRGFLPGVHKVLVWGGLAFIYQGAFFFPLVKPSRGLAGTLNEFALSHGAGCDVAGNQL